MQDIKTGSLGSRNVYGISLNEGSEILTLPLNGTFSVLEESCASVSMSDTSKREISSSDIGVGGSELLSWGSGGTLMSSLTFLASGMVTSASSASLFLSERKECLREIVLDVRCQTNMAIFLCLSFEHGNEKSTCILKMRIYAHAVEIFSQKTRI